MPHQHLKIRASTPKKKKRKPKLLRQLEMTLSKPKSLPKLPNNTLRLFSARSHLRKRLSSIATDRSQVWSLKKISSPYSMLAKLSNLTQQTWKVSTGRVRLMWRCARWKWPSLPSKRFASCSPRTRTRVKSTNSLSKHTSLNSLPKLSYMKRPWSLWTQNQSTLRIVIRALGLNPLMMWLPSGSFLSWSTNVNERISTKNTQLWSYRRRRRFSSLTIH